MRAVWRLLAALILIGLATVGVSAGSSDGETRYGVFTLPADKPYAIALDAEIGDTITGDFELALAARPNASVLLLNSPGGFVDKALIIANAVRERGMATLIPDGSGCFSACAYIYFAGAPRHVDGQLGVHQIDTKIHDLVFAQNMLSDVLDALYVYGVQQTIISHMLRTPPTRMYVFTRAEIADWAINAGDPVQLAAVSVDVSAGFAANATASMDHGAYLDIAHVESRNEPGHALEAARNH